MAKGILNIQAADGAVIGLHVPDGLTSGERQIALGTNLSGITAYHLLQGNLAVSNSTTTQGFNTTLYTGNGSTQSITTGIDMSTQWGNDASETFGGLVWVKGRSNVTSHYFGDTIRGSTWNISSDSTTNQLNNTTGLTAITNTGFNVGSLAAFNSSGWTFSSWNFQTTHRVTGTTNHGQAYECHYNPFTGFTMVKYTGSGLAGHEIPHHLGRKLGFVTVKNLSAVSDWFSTYLSGDNYIYLNLTTASQYSGYNMLGDTNILLPNSSISYNTASNTYIIYGWANSYFDKANKLIGNYEIGVYQGTGASGNKVPTRGKPAWVMIKRLDSTANWVVFDNMRGSGNSRLFQNLSNSEGFLGDYPSNYSVRFDSDGMTFAFDDGWSNASGGQYLYMVAYDTNANGGGTYYPLTSDTANVQVNNALIPIAQGIDSNGAKNTILSKNETFSGVTYTQGKNYPYYDAIGNRGVSSHKPRYLESELARTYAGESPDYFNVKENKWYNTNSGSELVTNGKFSSGVTTGWTGYSYTGSIFVTDATILTATGNVGTVTVASGKTYPTMEQVLSTVIGVKYKVKFSKIATTATFLACIATQSIAGTNTFNAGSLFYFDTATTGDYEYEFVANQTSYYLRAGCSSVTVGQYSKFDNFTSFKTTIIPTTEITESRNYMNHIVHADADGGVLYVEELPKIEYKDIVKANEFKGKNACTACASINGGILPPTIYDNVNISSVIKLSTGVYKLYFKERMDNTNYSITTTMYGDQSQTTTASVSLNNVKTLDSVTIYTRVSSGSAYDQLTDAMFDVHIFGGRN